MEWGSEFVNTMGLRFPQRVCLMDLLLSLIFSSVGGVYFFIGRREREPLYLIVGALLIVYPYFVTQTALIIGIGIVLIAVPPARNRGWF